MSYFYYYYIAYLKGMYDRKLQIVSNGEAVRVVSFLVRRNFPKRILYCCMRNSCMFEFNMLFALSKKKKNTCFLPKYSSLFFFWYKKTLLLVLELSQIHYYSLICQLIKTTGKMLKKKLVFKQYNSKLL